MEYAHNSALVSHLKILIIEDDPSIVDFLKLGLEHEGFEVAFANDGSGGIKIFQHVQPALVILDLRLPDLDGEEVCKSLRNGSNVPILVLTARDQINDKIQLLTTGADDYMVKPFSFNELLARIRSLLRRSGSPLKQQWLRFLDIEMRLDTREVFRGGNIIKLCTEEFNLLHLFMSNPNSTLSRETILNSVWGNDYSGDNRILEMYVSHLRRKLGRPVVIQTILQVGYRLRSYP